MKLDVNLKSSGFHRNAVSDTLGLLVIVLLPLPSVHAQCLQFNGTCVEACPTEYVATGHKCVKACPSGFTTALDNLTCGNCTGRSPNESCATGCPSGTYALLTNESASCAPCDTLCSVCTGPDINQCVNCTSVKFNNSCVAECPPPYMGYRGECVLACPVSTFFISGQNFCFDHCPESHRFHQGSECQSWCDNVVHNLTCVDTCPNGTYYVTGDNVCFDACPDTHPHHFRGECVKACPRAYRYTLNGECVSMCPVPMRFVPGERECIDKCPRHIALAFNQVCMRKCPPGTYRILEETGFRCLPYVGLRGIAAVVTALLVLLCVVFGICMSKQYNVVRKTEDSVAAMVQESEKAVMNDESGRYKGSATIGLIHVNSDRRSSAEQPLLTSNGV